MRPADLGVLTSCGVTSVEVYRRPSISIISTGDEIVSPDTVPGPGKVRDINTYTLAALAEKLGFNVIEKRVVTDAEEELSLS